MSNKDNKENYIKQYPEINKWLNQCIICQTQGYKPNLPDKIYPGFLADNIRRFYNVLEVDEIGICTDCQKHYKKITHQ